MTQIPRHADHEIDPLFLRRWSPRAFDGSLLTQADLLRLIEAARWAPSSFNSQPWRFCYALRGDAHWEPFLELLLPFNRTWAETASAIVFILSEAYYRDPQSDAMVYRASHAFDAGAAWASFAFQATLLDMSSHAMLGFDAKAARQTLKLPDQFEIQAAVAVGRQGNPAILPEKLRNREVPSGRLQPAEIAFAGPLS